MYCAQCGNQVRDDASFCSVCGAPVKTAVSVPVAASYAPAAARDAAKKGPNRKKIIIAVAVAAAVVVAVVAGISWWISGQNAKAHSLHAVPIEISISGYDGTVSARYAASVTGADLDGNEVNETQYVDASGNGIELCRGTYTVRFEHYNIADDGTVIAPSATELSVTVGDNLDAGEALSGGEDRQVIGSVVADSDVTDAMVADAKAIIASDSQSSGSAEALAAKANERHAAAVAQAEAETFAQQITSFLTDETYSSTNSDSSQGGYDAISGWWQVGRLGGCYVYHCVGDQVYYYNWDCTKNTATYKGVYTFTATRVENGSVSGTGGTYEGGCYCYSGLPAMSKWDFYIFDDDPDILINEEGTTELFLRLTASSDSWGSYDKVTELAEQYE